VTADEPLLEMRGITMSFPGVRALDEVHLTLRSGEVVAVCGENGAGKSTLMNVVGGVLRPDAGQILVSGREVEIRGVPQAIDLGIGFVHQELSSLDNLSIAGNIFLGREPVWAGPLKLIDRASIHREAEPYLQLLGLDRSPDTPVSELSLAERQIVEIARALSLDARILILDEPTSSLTVSETRRLFEVIRGLRSRGAGVLYISHRLGEIEQIADRVEVLRDGRHAGSLERAEITHDGMVSLMVGRNLSQIAVEPRAWEDHGYLEVDGLSTSAHPGARISYGAARGEILGFAGLVGAGRSEMARAVFGVDRPLGGSVSLEGKRLEIKSPRDAIRHGIGLVPEERRRSGLVVEMTVRENVSLPTLSALSPGGLIRRDRETRAAERQREALGIQAPSVESLVQNLSGGNQQKVALARWLEAGPRVLILDEPTRGVDVAARSEIHQLVRRLADDGVVVLLISSDIEEVLGVSDRIAVMCEGSIAGVLGRDRFDGEAVMRLAVGGAGS
jgi:ribose transport system ATP-binding protein